MTERYRGEETQLFPVSSKAIEQAFPQGLSRKDDISRLLIKESHNMQTENIELYESIKFGSLEDTYGSAGVNLAMFKDGAIFMHRILRHNTTELPIISKDAIDLFDMGNKRDIQDKGKGMKKYFADQWHKEFASKGEHGQLGHTIQRIGEIRTNKTEEVWGGAYYMARIYQGHTETQKLNRDYNEESQKMRQIFLLY